MANRRSRAGLPGPLRVLWDGGTLAGLGDGPLLDRFAGRRDEVAAVAFEALILRHGPMVLRVCEQTLGDRHAAEDAFQAVFLVLARKAGSIRRPDRLGPWLYGVALKTAGEARSREGRRRRLERAGATIRAAEDRVADGSDGPGLALERREAAELLHGVIARLPERYRAPVVLCELEGLTHQEAALRLRCPVATVGVRLKRARERLRAGLARRGLDPSAVVPAVVPSSFAMARAVAPDLAGSTVRAAIRFAAGKVVPAGTVPASAVLLASKVLKSMTLLKLKLATAVVLALGLAAVGGRAGMPRPAAAQDAPKPVAQDAPKPVAPDTPAPAPRDVEVTRPVSREVRDSEDFNGRTEASRSSEIRPPVGGLVEMVAFRDGQEVKKGDLLFQINPRSYRAQMDLAEAQVAQAEARLIRLSSNASRADALVKRDVIGQGESDRVVGDLAEGKAGLAVAKAGRDRVKLDLDATRVLAPFDGEMGRRLVEEGTPVKAGETPMATISAVDPIRVTFDVDERTFLRARRRVRDGKAGAELPVLMGLADEDGFPRRGTARLDGGRIAPEMGMASIRAEFPNDDRSLVPGLFARVRLEVGNPRPALLVPQSAILAGGGQKGVYVVNDRDIVEVRPVVLGGLYNGLRLVRQGLAAGDRVVVAGLRDVGPGMAVKPRPIPGPGEEPGKP